MKPMLMIAELIVAVSIVQTCKGDVHTVAEAGTTPLPTADFVLIVQEDKITVYDTRDWSDPIEVGSFAEMPHGKDEMRVATLNIMVEEVAVMFHVEDKMFVIIDDQYTPSKYYRANIKMISPEDVSKK
jgi:hypothetical protein